MSTVAKYKSMPQWPSDAAELGKAVGGMAAFIAAHLALVQRVEAIERTLAANGYEVRDFHAGSAGNAGVRPVDERQQFEAAMRELHPEWSFTPDPVFGYHNERTRLAWESWQAALGVSVDRGEPKPPTDAAGKETGK